MEAWEEIDDIEELRGYVRSLLEKHDRVKAAHRQQIEALTREVRFLEKEVQELQLSAPSQRSISDPEQKQETSEPSPELAKFSPITDAQYVRLPKTEKSMVVPSKGSNVVSLSGATLPSGSILVSGTANRELSVFALATAEQSPQFQAKLSCPGPPISLALLRGSEVSSNALIGAAGCMDGSVSVFRAEKSKETQCWGLQEVSVFRRIHEKFITSVVASISGNLCASGAADGTCCIFVVQQPADAQPTLELKKKLYFEAPIEAVCAVAMPPQTEQVAHPTSWFALSVRGHSRVYYIDGESTSIHSVALNCDNESHPLPWVRTGEEPKSFLPVGFTVLHMQGSPDGQFVAKATDQSQVAVYFTGTNKVFRRLTGLTSSKWASPKLAWHPTLSSILFGSSEVDFSIYIWNVPAGQVIASLEGHQAAVRGLVALPTPGSCTDEDISDQRLVLATGSFDKTLRVWS